jgi:hypothetical protein
VARLDELLDDRHLQALRPFARRLALGGNRVAVRANIDRRVELALGGDTQVEHRRTRP